ncbi:hypothetical protein GCM10028778_23610 [Barrientosiimonas marina]|uniref:Uncharacterized protein n=1 Tax=Lentibacillus kimchii TaxID=1542911 RepID=A0ABW2UVM1_9BACI
MLNIKTIDRALLAGLAAGIAAFIMAFFFPDTSKFISIIIGALAACAGYMIGDKLFAGDDQTKGR